MKIKSFDDLATFQTKIIFYFDEGNIKRIYNPMTMEVKELKNGEITPEEYIFKIPIEHKQSMIDCLVDEFSKQGYEPKHESKIEGKLQATEYHLEDMRKLLKLS